MSGKLSGDSFGFPPGSVVQEFGYDEDVDFDLRDSIDESIELVDEDYPDVVDGVIAWWREDDGNVDDLADYLVDVKTSLADSSAPIWLLVPSPREAGAVPANDVKEGAETAGLVATTSFATDGPWIGYRLSARGQRRG